MLFVCLKLGTETKGTTSQDDQEPPKVLLNALGSQEPQ